MARTRPPAPRETSRARSSRARAKRRAALPALDSGELIAPPAPKSTAPTAASSGPRTNGAGRGAARVPTGPSRPPIGHARRDGRFPIPAGIGPGAFMALGASRRGALSRASGSLRDLYVSEAYVLGVALTRDQLAAAGALSRAPSARSPTARHAPCSSSACGICGSRSRSSSSIPCRFPRGRDRGLATRKGPPRG